MPFSPGQVIGLQLSDCPVTVTRSQLASRNNNDCDIERTKTRAVKNKLASALACEQGMSLQTEVK